MKVFPQFNKIKRDGMRGAAIVNGSSIFYCPDTNETLGLIRCIFGCEMTNGYKPTVNLNCLQNVMLEVLIRMTGNVGLPCFVISGETMEFELVNASQGIIRDYIVQVDPQEKWKNLSVL